MKLVRSRSGDRYHRPDCRYADPEMSWVWAADRALEEVEATARNGVYPCRVCEPLATDDRPQSTLSDLVRRYGPTR